MYVIYNDGFIKFDSTKNNINYTANIDRAKQFGSEKEAETFCKGKVIKYRKITKGPSLI